MTATESLAALRAEHKAETQALLAEHSAEVKALQMEALLSGAEPVEQTLKTLGISGTAGLPPILEAFAALKTQNATQAAQITALNAQIEELNAQLNP